MSLEIASPSPRARNDHAGTHGPVISLKGLTKVYGGVVRAVDHLDLTIERSQVFGLLGPNGAGKTTVLRMLLGLTWRPDEIFSIEYL